MADFSVNIGETRKGEPGSAPPRTLLKPISTNIIEILENFPNDNLTNERTPLLGKWENLFVKSQWALTFAPTFIHLMGIFRIWYFLLFCRFMYYGISHEFWIRDKKFRLFLVWTGKDIPTFRRLWILMELTQIGTLRPIKLYMIGTRHVRNLMGTMQ